MNVKETRGFRPVAACMTQALSVILRQRVSLSPINQPDRTCKLVVDSAGEVVRGMTCGMITSGRRRFFPSHFRFDRLISISFRRTLSVDQA